MDSVVEPRSIEHKPAAHKVSGICVEVEQGRVVKSVVLFLKANSVIGD